MRKTEIEKILKEAEKRETQVLIDCVEQTIDASRIEWVEKSNGRLICNLLPKKGEYTYQLDLDHTGVGWVVELYKSFPTHYMPVCLDDVRLSSDTPFFSTIWRVNEILKSIKSGKPVRGEVLRTEEWQQRYGNE